VVEIILFVLHLPQIDSDSGDDGSIRGRINRTAPFCIVHYINPLVPSVLLKGRYKKLDVKNAIGYSNEKMSNFSHPRSLATELTTLSP